MVTQMATQIATQSPIIEVRGLVKNYGTLPVLRKLDLCVRRGEFLTLLGPNGSGKSTLLRLLAGLLRPTAGTIVIGGWKLPEETFAVRAQIGLVGHQPLLYENLSARENLQFFARLYGVRSSEKRIDQLLEHVGLAKRAHDKVSTFSRGMQQRLSIARALLHKPHILLLDEPYTGLDQDASVMLDDLLKTAHSEGHTLVMVSHQFDRATALANRVMILSRGSIAFETSTENLSAMQLASYYTNVTSKVTAQ